MCNLQWQALNKVALISTDFWESMINIEVTIHFLPVFCMWKNICRQRNTTDTKEGKVNFPLQTLSKYCLLGKTIPGETPSNYKMIQGRGDGPWFILHLVLLYLIIFLCVAPEKSCMDGLSHNWEGWMEDSYFSYRVLKVSSNFSSSFSFIDVTNSPHLLFEDGCEIWFLVGFSVRTYSTYGWCRAIHP